MIPINYPTPEFSMKKAEGKDWLFDSIRKKWVIITPEEWVRQNFIQYLIKTLQYPAASIAVEKGFHLGEMQKRVDILVYHQHTPWMLIECKEPNIPLNEKILQQILAYHVTLPCPYIVVTNGNLTLGFAIDAAGKATSILQLPAYS